MVDKVLSIIAPHLCSGCGIIGSTFCDNCKYDIISEPFSDCIMCGKTSNYGICEDHKLPFYQAWVVGVRSGPLQRLIGGFKFRNMKSAYIDLADLLHRRLPSLPLTVVVVPIPTSSKHIRERGYDHMSLIAREFARLRGLRMQSLLTKNNTLVQHHANREQRLRQASSAFSLKAKVESGTTYLIIDDVITTGATISEAARLFKNAGAYVLIAVIARQPLD